MYVLLSRAGRRRSGGQSDDTGGRALCRGGTSAQRQSADCKLPHPVGDLQAHLAEEGEDEEGEEEDEGESGAPLKRTCLPPVLLLPPQRHLR